jgi:polyhydroxybutyrate depolymerase
VKYLFFLLVFATVVGCGSSDSNNSGGSGGQVFSADPPLTIGGERPAAVDIPQDYDPNVAHPLLVFLHGFGTVTGEAEAAFFGVLNVVDEKDLVLLLPDGTLNEDGARFWNGAARCCDPNDAIDDVGYLSGLIEEARQTYNIDEKRVYLLGYSNGGFMSFRMACEASEFITAIVSLAGSTFADPADCQPATRPVSVLQVHGTADTVILYEGDADRYSSAVDTVESFASAAGCDTDLPTILGNIDLVSIVEGEETEQVAYTTGCQDGVDAALWTIRDGAHRPIFYQPGAGGAIFADRATDWLLHHSR